MKDAETQNGSLPAEKHAARLLEFREPEMMKLKREAWKCKEEKDRTKLMAVLVKMGILKLVSSIDEREETEAMVLIMRAVHEEKKQQPKAAQMKPKGLETPSRFLPVKIG